MISVYVHISQEQSNRNARVIYTYSDYISVICLNKICFPDAYFKRITKILSTTKIIKRCRKKICISSETVLVKFLFLQIIYDTIEV